MRERVLRYGDQLLLVLLALSLAATPLASASVALQAHDFARMVQVGLITAVAVLAWFDLAMRRDSVRMHVSRGALGLLTLLTVLMAASVWHAQVLRTAMLEVGLLTSLAVLALATFMALEREDAFRWAAYIVLGSAALLSFAVVIRYVAGMVEGQLSLWWVVPGFSNYRFFNHVQSITVPLLVAALVWPGLPQRWRRVGLGLLALEFCWLLFTGGRATMLGLGAATATVAFLYRRQALAWLRTLAVGAALGLLLFVVFFVALPHFFDVKGDFSALDTVQRTAGETAQTRRYLWTLAVDAVGESPWWGIGPQHFAHRPNVEAAHPHNIYLQLAADWGVPMLILVLMSAALGLRRLVGAVRHSGQEAGWGVGLTAVAVAVAVDGFFSGNFVMPNSQMWMVFALALALVYVRRNRVVPNIVVSRQAFHRGVGATLIALTLTALWQGIWPEVLDVPAHVQRVQGQVANVVSNPRFWSHGWF